MLVEEGTYISSHKGELLNSKNEWHQAKIIRTATRVIQGGADLLRQQQGGGRAGVQPQGSRVGGRTWGQWGDFLKPSMSVCFLFGPAILTILGPWHFTSRSDQGRNAETVFSINSLLSKPLNPWTETKPDWLEYDCVAAQGLDRQTHFWLSTDDHEGLS